MAMYGAASATGMARVYHKPLTAELLSYDPFLAIFFSTAAIRRA